MLTQSDYDELMDMRGIFAFDTPVETGRVSADGEREIMSLGYYGKPITAEAVKALNEGKDWSEPEFGLQIDACDGSSIKEFDSIEDLTKEAHGWRGSIWTGKNTATCEGTRIRLIGATWKDVGMKMSDCYLGMA